MKPSFFQCLSAILGTNVMAEILFHHNSKTTVCENIGKRKLWKSCCKKIVAFYFKSIMPQYNWNIVESGVKHQKPNQT